MKDLQVNVCKKYGISRDELKEAVEQYSRLATGKFGGKINCLLAILDLLTVGDIENDKRN